MCIDLASLGDVKSGTIQVANLVLFLSVMASASARADECINPFLRSDRVSAANDVDPIYVNGRTVVSPVLRRSNITYYRPRVRDPELTATRQHDVNAFRLRIEFLTRMKEEIAGGEYKKWWQQEVWRNYYNMRLIISESQLESMVDAVSIDRVSSLINEVEPAIRKTNLWGDLVERGFSLEPGPGQTMLEGVPESFLEAFRNLAPAIRRHSEARNRFDSIEREYRQSYLRWPYSRHNRKTRVNYLRLSSVYLSRVTDLLIFAREQNITSFDQHLLPRLFGLIRPHIYDRHLEELARNYSNSRIKDRRELGKRILEQIARARALFNVVDANSSPVRVVPN